MIQFSYRAKRDTDPKWGPKGRRYWLSDCSRYRIEERFEYEGVAIPKSQRFLAMIVGIGCVLGRSRSKYAAIARCTKHARGLVAKAGAK